MAGRMLQLVPVLTGQRCLAPTQHTLLVVSNRMHLPRLLHSAMRHRMGRRRPSVHRNKMLQMRAPPRILQGGTLSVCIRILFASLRRTALYIWRRDQGPMSRRRWTMLLGLA
jgi:hypothetical protein